MFRFSPTNSPIESYNNSIKTQFTKRIKYHMIPALRVFKSFVKYQTTYESHIFSTQGKVTATINSQAQIIVKNKLLINSFDKYIFHYMGNLSQRYTIEVEKKSCDFYFFKDKAVCKHLAAACMQNNIFLNGLKIKPLRLRYIRRKMTKKVSSIISRSEFLQASQNFIPDNLNCQEQFNSSIPDVQTLNVEKTCILFGTHKHVSPKKTVKKGLSINQNIVNTFVQQPKRGRPTLAEKPLNLKKKVSSLIVFVISLLKSS